MSQTINEFGKTPLHYAIDKQHYLIINFLLENTLIDKTILYSHHQRYDPEKGEFIINEMNYLDYAKWRLGNSKEAQAILEKIENVMF